MDKLRVLVVDDSKVIRKAFARILSSNYDLCEAEDGESAWKILNEDEGICAVFTDLNMPRLDGRGLIEKIRAADDEELKHLPVILVTANDDSEETTKSVLTAGATDFVQKPFDSVFLQSKAKAHVKPREKTVNTQSVATLDPLTRLANRTYFIERGNQEMSAAIRRELDLSVLLIEIDQFESLANSIDPKLLKGIIRKLGSYISSEVRLEDTVGRIDKHRYAILLSETGLENAIELGNRISLKVSQKIIRHKEDVFKITVSIGASGLPTNIKRSFEMLMMDSERHLREAIEQGGNVVLPESSQSPGDSVSRSPAIGSLDQALSILKRKKEKLTAKQAEQALVKILPLLEYCDDVLDLDVAEAIKKLKSKYSV